MPRKWYKKTEKNIPTQTTTHHLPPLQYLPNLLPDIDTLELAIENPGAAISSRKSAPIPQGSVQSRVPKRIMGERQWFTCKQHHPLR
ncbi:hypothetical protein AVEN_101430-1 [Araneus ventricosus]|uniref:Uncharacterized protein n=1 Tax=Araneus ventricosus TaxID=182803 RepID=A0A4Y2CW28_ARAVE|nr:hypothetical protein AVEN_101430-1 [Araneus ventricosus]